MSHLSQAQINNYVTRREQALSMRREISSKSHSLRRYNNISVHSSCRQRLQQLQSSLNSIREDNSSIIEINYHNEDYAASKINQAYSNANNLHNIVSRLQRDFQTLVHQSDVAYEDERLQKEQEAEQRRLELLRQQENVLLKTQIENAITEIKETISNSVFTVQKLKDKCQEKAIKSLEGLLSGINSRTENFEDYAKKIVPISEEFHELYLKEEARWKSCESIIYTLQDLKMNVTPGYNSEEDTLVIRASNQTNEEIVFKLNDTKVVYEFEGYEGDTCFDATDKVEEILQEVYGIQLDDHVIIKGNPDRIKKTAKSNPVAPPKQQQGGK